MREGTSEEQVRLGTVAVGDYQGLVLFQDPADDGEGYRVDVAISKPNETEAIDSARIDVWLLARGGRALAVRNRPHPGPLIEVNSAGTTADAIYFFAGDAERKELVGAVVSVDGELTTLKVTPLKKKGQEDGPANGQKMKQDG